MTKSRCESCIYWRRLSWAANSRRACHYLLETGQRRRKDAKGACLEFKKKSDGCKMNCP